MRFAVLILAVALATSSFAQTSTASTNESGAAVADDAGAAPSLAGKGVSAPSSRCTDLYGAPEACPEPVAGTLRRTHTDNYIRVRAVPYDILHQQAQFWTSPFRLRERDLSWGFPFALATTALVIADPTIDKHMAPHKSIVSTSQTFGNASIALIVGSAGGMYVWGHMRHNERMASTGFMAGEAGLNSFLTTTVFKEFAQRARPMDVAPPGSRGFRQGGSSFPSEHSAAAWSVATVVAHQYPGTGTKILAYGLAAAVSASRITGRQHFSSDAFLGSALGWYIGRQVWESHQVPDMKQWGTFERNAHEGPRSPESMASPYVPLDSWVYEAFDRLAALGYVQSAFRDMRPWTRIECARLLDEAQPLVSSSDSRPDVARLYAALRSEFAPEVGEIQSGRNTGIVLDSVYMRLANISGTPLRDGYHFGQTIIDDYGRPYGRGMNVVTGISGYATAGPVVGYIRGEYQRSPSMPGIPTASAPLLSEADHGIPPSAYPAVLASTSTFDLLEGYVGLKVGTSQFTFGRQALSWGPTGAGGMLFSNNAAPITMLRITQPKPFKLPSIFGKLGAVRTDFFVGRLSGHDFAAVNGVIGTPGLALDPQPYIHGEKISFKPTPNFEFSIARTTILSGPGFPFTSRTFFKSIFSTNTSNASGQDSGDRRSSFDFSYRIPKLRDRVLLYMDSFTDDQISPLAYPRNAAVNPGISLSQVPGLSKLDFRAEGLYTPYDHFPGFFYFNVRYLQGYTNKGQLLGSWIGRQGTGYQAWSDYHFSARTKVGVSFRSAQVDRDFLRGGSLRDYSVHADIALNRGVTFSTFVQYERWNFPLLAATTQHNVTASVQVEYRPQWRIK